MNACRAGVLVFSLVLVLLCTSVSVAQDGGVNTLTVSQRNDGNVIGLVELTDPTYTLSIPTRAEVYFLQDGKLIGRYLSNEWGHFQVPGLEPGASYSVIAKVDDLRIGFYTVEVYPYVEEQASVSPEFSPELLPIEPVSMTIVEDTIPDVLNLKIVDSTLTTDDLPPTPDSIIPPPSQTGMNAPMSSAPRGGGAGGLGAALGIAGGVLGMVALATDDDPATPAAP